MIWLKVNPVLVPAPAPLKMMKMMRITLKLLKKFYLQFRIQNRSLPKSLYLNQKFKNETPGWLLIRWIFPLLFENCSRNLKILRPRLKNRPDEIGYQKPCLFFQENNRPSSDSKSSKYKLVQTFWNFFL